MGLAAVGHIKLMPGVTAGRLFAVSELIGRGVSKLRPLREPKDSTYPETVEDREVA